LPEPREARSLVALAAAIQRSIFIICGFGALGYAATGVFKRNGLAAFASVAIAGLFLANFLFVPVFSRIVLVVAPVFAGLLGWRLYFVVREQILSR
jgi:hypothetical protein